MEILHAFRGSVCQQASDVRKIGANGVDRTATLRFQVTGEALCGGGKRGRDLLC